MYIQPLSAFAVSFIIGIILYIIFIPVLRRVKLGQKILEIGPAWHKSKEGTPTLGGLFFIISILISVLVFILPDIFNEEFRSSIFTSEKEKINGVLAVFGLALIYGLIGFIDDYVKLFKKSNKGLSASQKLVLQFLGAAFYLWVRMQFCGGTTIVILPFTGSELDLGILYHFFMILLIVYLANCANLTDGIDGLAGSVAIVLGVFFLILSIEAGENSSMTLIAASIGAIMAFLIFNFHPAKIWMGDTGSLFLGGLFTGLAVHFRAELLMIFILFVWLFEGLSVVIQVTSFKLTGKRIFKMSPIHHHFEMKGWSEYKIVFVFSMISAVMCGLTYFLYNFNR